MVNGEVGVKANTVDLSNGINRNMPLKNNDTPLTKTDIMGGGGYLDNGAQPQIFEHSTQPINYTTDGFKGNEVLSEIVKEYDFGKWLRVQRCCQMHDAVECENEECSENTYIPEHCDDYRHCRRCSVRYKKRKQMDAVGRIILTDEILPDAKYIFWETTFSEKLRDEISKEIYINPDPEDRKKKRVKFKKIFREALTEFLGGVPMDLLRLQRESSQKPWLDKPHIHLVFPNWVYVDHTPRIKKGIKEIVNYALGDIADGIIWFIHDDIIEYVSLEVFNEVPPGEYIKINPYMDTSKDGSNPKKIKDPLKTLDFRNILARRLSRAFNCEISEDDIGVHLKYKNRTKGIDCNEVIAMLSHRLAYMFENVIEKLGRGIKGKNDEGKVLWEYSEKGEGGHKKKVVCEVYPEEIERTLHKIDAESKRYSWGGAWSENKDTREKHLKILIKQFGNESSFIESNESNELKEIFDDDCEMKETCQFCRKEFDFGLTRCPYCGQRVYGKCLHCGKKSARFKCRIHINDIPPEERKNIVSDGQFLDGREFGHNNKDRPPPTDFDRG